MVEPSQRFVQSCLAVVDGQFINHLRDNFPATLYQAFTSKRAITMSMDITFMPEMMLLHMYTQYYFCNYYDEKLQKRIARYSSQNYRMLARLMKECGELVINSKVIVKVIKERFGMDNFEYMRFRMMHEYEGIEEQEPDMEEIQRHLFKSMEKVELEPAIQPVIASDHVVKITSSRSMMEPSTPLTNEGSSIKMSHESSSSKLTPSQPIKSIKSSIGKDSATSRMAYDDRRSRVEEISVKRSRDEEFSVRSSVQEMKESDSDYNPRTLPNTKSEAVRWLGVSDLPYEAYLSTPGGRLCQHELVANLVDINGSSSVYNSTQTLMMMFYPYVVDVTYHRIDHAKKDFGINDRAKYITYDQKYDGNQCLYEHTTKLINHYSSYKYPYVKLYDVLSKGDDLAGTAREQWHSYVRSANLSLMKNDITNVILLSQIPQSFQMRDIAELIIDLVVFRVLIFGKLKSKVSVREELQKQRLSTTLPGVHYDGILSLVQHAIHMSRLFLDDDNAVQDLVNTLVQNVSKTSQDHAMLAIDLNANLSQEIRLYRIQQSEYLASLSRRDATLNIFGCIERFCRKLQTVVRQTLSSSVESDAVKVAYVSTTNRAAAPSTLNSYNRRQQPTRYVVSPTSTYPHTPFKRTQIHSAQLSVEPGDNEERISEAYLYDRSSQEPIDEAVMAELEPLHRDGKASALRKFYWEADYSKLPEGAAILPSRELEGALTIHINMVKSLGDAQGEVRMLDTKCTIEPRFSGICTLCGRKGHDQGHCRMRGYNSGPNGEVMANLAAWSYFDDVKLNEEMIHAIEHGFLQGTTEAERNWVRQTVARLRSERFLLYQGKTQGIRQSHYRPPQIGNSGTSYSNSNRIGLRENHSIYGNGMEEKSPTL